MKTLFAAVCLSLSGVVLAGDLQSEGKTALSEGDAASAIIKFTEAAKVNPFDPAALNNLAVALAAQGNYEKALETLERAYRLAPTRGDIQANLQSMRTWVARNAPQIQLKESKAKPVVNTYPDADIPLEPPPLWKK